MFIREVLDALARSGVEACLVGGVAVNLHGVPRMTYDVDLVVSLERGQLVKTQLCLNSLGLRCRQPLQLESLADQETRETLLRERNLMALTYSDPSNPLREVDVLVSPPIDPSSILRNAVVFEVEGLSVRVASLDDMIQMKRAAARPQDAADLEHLLRLAAMDE